MPASPQLVDAYRHVLTPQQRALAIGRIRSGERPACGDDYDRLRVNGKVSVAILAVGGSETDLSHDEEAVAVIERLVERCGSVPFEVAYLSKCLLSKYFYEVAQADPDAILDALVAASV